MLFKIGQCIVLAVCVIGVIFIWYGVETQCEDVAIYEYCDK